jgi:hypothetical protein
MFKKRRYDQETHRRFGTRKSRPDAKIGATKVAFLVFNSCIAGVDCLNSPAADGIGLFPIVVALRDKEPG